MAHDAVNSPSLRAQLVPAPAELPVAQKARSPDLLLTRFIHLDFLVDHDIVDADIAVQ